MIMELDGFCDSGLKRQENQDHIFTAKDKSGALAVLADGMGGYRNGGEASKILCDCFSAWWNETDRCEGKNSFSITMDGLETVLKDANEKIFSQFGCKELCGTTALILWMETGRWGLLSVGDSRCYQMKNGLLGQKLIQRSIDDVWENQDAVRKQYSQKERREHSNYGKLTCAVGAGAVLRYHRMEGFLRKRDLFCLCSDGVFRYCKPDVFRNSCAAAWRQEMKQCLGQILADVYEHGAPDNLSAIMIKVQQ